jgi:cytochrome c553
MNLTIFRQILLFFALLWVATAYAASPDGKRIAHQGNGKGAIACISCHGQQGMGNASAGYPYLAGLPIDYIKNQLTAFRDGSRSNAVMKPIASALTTQEIAAVAEYYSKLNNSILSSVKTTSSSQYATGEKLAHNGKWEAGVPSCFKCHGANGKGVAPHFPPIIGQPYQYLKSQLLAWQQGKRSNDPIGLMQAVTKHLNQDEINSVAHYLASQASQ